jgi:hypothetical protein
MDHRHRRRRPRRPRRRDCPGAPEATRKDIPLPFPSEVANVAMVTGAIMEVPLRVGDGGPHPMTVLLISFAAPDAGANPYQACLEIDAPDPVIGSQRHLLDVGRRIVVVGRLTGAGGLLASALVADGAEHSPRQEDRDR